MLRFKCIFLTLLGLLSQPSQAQENAKYELLIQTTSGSYATRLEDLVGASDVIIRGRYGAVASMEQDYGGNTVENIMKQTGRPEEEAALYGIPMASHEIIIDRIIKANDDITGSNVLIVRMAESPDALKVFSWLADFREGEHLFFLRHHPDRSFYSLRGEMFDMKKIDESYYYLDSEQKYVPVFGSEDSEVFLQSIKDIINECCDFSN